MTHNFLCNSVSSIENWAWSGFFEELSMLAHGVLPMAQKWKEAHLGKYTIY